MIGPLDRIAPYALLLQTLHAADLPGETLTERRARADAARDIAGEDARP